ncbi:hypothetical protein AQUCO_04500141v1 [Aquilegia coerulea]|uniref:Wax synthase domain-containing protein n=1 Tax=Aquilegia coerulea TaxID=218851 RepID=A0A2G5CM22_AQUCA|nr:hypothetical protein AQUCO_04500141v1 [Aquilegia coerulea]
MEGVNEIQSLIKKHINRSIRLFFILPIISLFTILPLYLSSFHFVLITSFFITWLCNFKLILFVFNQGPLSSDPSISLLRFISIACLPIKMKNNKNPSQEITKKGLKSTWNYSIKFLLLVLVIKIGDYKQSLHPDILLALYSWHAYFGIEIVLAIVAAPALAWFGIETEPQFNEPHLSTSLQDFWGKRWNLMVTNILRPTIYIPIRYTCTRMVGTKCAKLAGMMATFVVSGLMHELIYFYVGRVLPTWEVTWYFILQGVYTNVEIVMKEAGGDRLQLNPVISRLLTIGFLINNTVQNSFPLPRKSLLKQQALLQQEKEALEKYTLKSTNQNVPRVQFSKKEQLETS